MTKIYTTNKELKYDVPAANTVGEAIQILYKQGERDFSGLDLEGVYLSFAKLRDADFRGTNLRDGHLRFADLRGVKFIEANLICTKFIEANLRDTDFCGAKLWGVKISKDVDLFEILRIERV